MAQFLFLLCFGINIHCYLFKMVGPNHLFESPGSRAG